MAQVALRNIVKTFDRTPAVQGINLDIADREFIVLVGPSGCGKSTTLRKINNAAIARIGAINNATDAPSGMSLHQIAKVKAQVAKTCV